MIFHGKCTHRDTQTLFTYNSLTCMSLGSICSGSRSTSGMDFVIYHLNPFIIYDGETKIWHTNGSNVPRSSVPVDNIIHLRISAQSKTNNGRFWILSEGLIISTIKPLTIHLFLNYKGFVIVLNLILHFTPKLVAEILAAMSHAMHKQNIFN